MGTDSSIICGMTIMIFLISSASVPSFSSSSARRAAFFLTCSFKAFASSSLDGSFFACPISIPTCLDSVFLDARSSLASVIAALFSASSRTTSSTSGSLSSWNFLRIFSFTSSGFSLTNLISSIEYCSLYNIITICYYFQFFPMS